MSNLLNKNINVISFIFYFLIFTYVYIFSLNNIINLWTFNELHINYSTGFIPRGFIGTIMLKLNGIGFEKRIFFSSIFYFFTFANFLLFLIILKKKIDNTFIFIFFAFNPSFILFNFYDLGGYARLEVFGIFSLLLHTYIAITKEEKRKQKNYYKNCYFFLIFPLLLINVLIHEVNFFLIPFHLILIWFIINKETSNIEKVKYYIPYIIFIPIAAYFWFNPITPEKAQLIFDQIQDKQFISASIIEAIGAPISSRSEFLYMTSPLTNLIKYFLIFLFYLIPILIVINSIDHFTKKKIYINILVVLPLFFLFYIGRDWGRWIHLILFSIFCINIYFINKKVPFRKKVNNKNKIFILFFILLIFFQFTFTRIPHCCNLVEKNISIYGGIISKIIVFNNLINNKIDVKSRFKSF